MIALDRDEDAIAVARERLGARSSRVTFVHEDYRQLPAVLTREGVAGVDGIVVDFGVSSMQLDTASRGFSFRQAGPLDMRMDRSKGATLQERIAATDETTLADVIWQFGEERRARRVARAVVEAQDRGELTDTLALASVVRRAAGSGSWERIDPATRTFQALRIWVNGELDGLDTFVEDAAGRLRKDGRLAVLAFHSLEDRVVKHTLRALQATGFEGRWRSERKGEAPQRVISAEPALPASARVEVPHLRPERSAAGERMDGGRGDGLRHGIRGGERMSTASVFWVAGAESSMPR